MQDNYRTWQNKLVCCVYWPCGPLHLQLCLCFSLFLHSNIITSSFTVIMLSDVGRGAVWNSWKYMQDIQYLTVILGDRGDAGEVTEKAAKPVTTVQDWGSTFVSMTQDIFKECLRTIPSRVCINHNRYFVPNTWCFLNLNQAVFMLKPNQSISTGHKIKLKGFNISMVCRNTNYLHFFWWLGHIYSILRRLTPSLMSKAWWAFG